MKSILQICATVLLLFVNTFYCVAQQASIAPDFAMVKLDGTSIALTDIEDRVIYISFWASWCGPCITNFKKYKEIRSALEAEGVLLLNVSIDDSDANWRNMVSKLELNGVNVLASKLDLFPDYQVSSIPLYEIVGKDGYFRYLSDESGRDILAQFRKWASE